MAERLAHLERLLAAWEAIGSRGGRRAATGFIASTLCQGPVLVGDAIRRCEGLILKDPSDRALEAIVTGRMSALVAMAGRAEEALALAERSSLGLGELGIILPTLVTRDAVAEAKEYAGDRAGATEEREATQRKFEEIYTGRPNARAISAAYKLALLYCDESRWEDAERQLAYGPELPVPVHFRQEAALRLAGRARVAAHNGRHGEAVGLATKAAELADQSDMLNLRGRLWETHAEVHSAAGDSTEANASLAKALLLYQQKGNLAAAERLRSTVRA
jgi:tetratricopeptide (TPR) repeat protein